MRGAASKQATRLKDTTSCVRPQRKREEQAWKMPHNLPYTSPARPFFLQWPRRVPICTWQNIRSNRYYKIFVGSVIRAVCTWNQVEDKQAI
jgi:hypothetical protein